MATIGFWPFRNWSTTNFFRKDDLFISSCENDLQTLRAVFKEPDLFKKIDKLLSSENKIF